MSDDRVTAVLVQVTAALDRLVGVLERIAAQTGDEPSGLAEARAQTEQVRRAVDGSVGHVGGADFSVRALPDLADQESLAGVVDLEQVDVTPPATRRWVQGCPLCMAAGGPHLLHQAGGFIDIDLPEDP